MTQHYQERAVLFGRDRSLVGVTCRPMQSHGEKPVIIFLNSGITHRIGTNRIHVMLARELARTGSISFRFDMAGIGDSIILPTSPVMSAQERTAIDIDDALAFAADELGARRFIMVGLCSGADNALRTMGRDERVVGGTLLDLNVYRTPGYYVRHFSDRLLTFQAWANVLSGKHQLVQRALGGLRAPPESGTESGDAVVTKRASISPAAFLPPDLMRDHFERIVARNGKILAIFTGGMEAQFNSRKQFFEMFPGLDFGDALALEYLEDFDHTFRLQHFQSHLRKIVLEWVQTADFESATPWTGEQAVSGEG